MRESVFILSWLYSILSYDMGVVLLFGQSILVKQQNDINFIWLQYYWIHDKIKHSLARFDVVINETLGAVLEKGSLEKIWLLFPMTGI